MHVCMHECMYVCMIMYVCMDAWMDAWMDVRMYVCMYVCRYVVWSYQFCFNSKITWPLSFAKKRGDGMSIGSFQLGKCLSQDPRCNPADLVSLSDAILLHLGHSRSLQKSLAVHHDALLHQHLHLRLPRKATTNPLTLW